MCSEELRLDLESFINRALDKGLHGWPVKEQERLPACHFRPKNVATPQLYVGIYSTPGHHGPFVGMNLGDSGFVRAQD